MFKNKYYDLCQYIDDTMVVDEDRLNLFDYQSVDDIQISSEFESNFTTKLNSANQKMRSLKIAFLDIETTGLDSSKCEIIQIGIRMVCQEKNFSKNIILNNEGSEQQIIIEFWNILVKSVPDILVTHNGFKFDIPFIHNRCKRLKVKSLFNIGDKLVTVSGSFVNGKPIQVNKTSLFVKRKQINLVDTYVLAAIYDKSANSLPSLSLKDLAIYFKIRDERRLELSYQQILQCWETKDFTQLQEYLKFDLIDTEGIFNKLFSSYFIQYLIVEKLSIQDTVLLSTAFKWEKLADLFCRNRQAISDEKIKYKGAITGVNPGLYKDCYKIDVSSMYPSIMLIYGLCSTKDKNGELLKFLKLIMNSRLEYKKLYKDTGNVNYNIIQNSLKILINSYYGYMGTGGYSYNCMKTAALVTAYGRAIVKLMCAALQQINVAECDRAAVVSDFKSPNSTVKIVEIDTDGIICQGGKPYDVLTYVQNCLPTGINIDLDWDNTHVYVPKAKSYLLFNGDKIKKIGIFKKRNRCQLELNFPIECIKYRLNNDETSLQEYKDKIVNKIVNRTIDINELFVTKKIPNYKVPTNNRLVAANLGNYGDKVTYYEAEQKRYHKRTGKQLKSHPIPTNNALYFIDYYLELIDKLYDEFDKVSTGLVEGDLTYKLSDLSLYLLQVS